MSKLNELRMEPYAEADALLNDWIDRVMKDIHWKTFENQEKWVYMSHELGEHRFPQFKGIDEVYEQFNYAFADAISWFKAYCLERWVKDIRLGNVDLGPDMEWDMRELLGDEYFEEWEAKAKEAIEEDYAETLGAERAKELFDKAWGRNA